MTPVKMRFRTDGSHWADILNFNTLEDIRKWGCYDEATMEEIAKTEPAQPGDVWRCNWYGGGFAGYIICCPICKHCHHWTTANNCSQPVEGHYKDADGNEKTYRSCVHAQQGNGSCWTWTGSAEENQLTAHPSLHNLDPACGFHGWLQNGMLTSC